MARVTYATGLARARVARRGARAVGAVAEKGGYIQLLNDAFQGRTITYLVSAPQGT
jgi:hypothetical protein